MTGPAPRGAIFLDRDGTLIADVGYIKNPDDVVLMPGAGEALRTAHQCQRPVIVITNQSGIARGRLTQQDYEAVHTRMQSLLSASGACVDAAYHCPHHPEFTGRCACRKPGVALFERAIRDHGLDGARATFIGDRWRDIAPALHFGGRGILVPSPTTPPEEIARARAEMTVKASLQDAVTVAVSNA